MKNNFQFLRIALFSAFIIIGFNTTVAQSTLQLTSKQKRQLDKISAANESGDVLKAASIASSLNDHGLDDNYCIDDANVTLTPTFNGNPLTGGSWLGAPDEPWVDASTGEFIPGNVPNDKLGNFISITYVLADAIGNPQSFPDYTKVHSLPQAYNLLGDNEICSGVSGSIQLDNSDGDIMYTFYRDPDFGGPQPPVAVGSAPGVGGVLYFSVTQEGRYTASGSNDLTKCENDMSGFIDVTVNPLPPVVATNNGPLCEGDPLTLSASPTGAEYTYAWTGPNGFTSTEQAPVINPTVAANDGLYNVTVTNKNTTCSSTANTTVVIKTIPIPTISGDQTVCLNSSVTYTTEPGMSNYVWTYPADFVPTSATNTNTITGAWTALGDDKIQVVYENGDACTSPVFGELEVTTGEATAGLTSNAVNDEVCINQAVTFTATGGVTYEFFVGTTSVLGPSALDTYTTSSLVNGDVVSVKVIDANDCEDTHPGITMTVLPEPIITLTTSDETPCQDTPIVLTATGATTYTFYKNGAIVQGPSTQSTFTTINPIVSGDQFYAIGNDGDCDGTSPILTINVNPLPTIGLVSDKGNVFCLNDIVTFAASNAVTYEFFVDNISQGTASSIATFTSSTLTNGQVVKVIGTDANGCEGENSITVTVNEITAVLNITNPSPPGSSVCSGTEVTFNASATGGSGNNSYEFFVNGISQGVSSNTIFKYTILSDTKISVKVIDVTLGCEDTEETDMIALALPSVSITNPSDGAAFCINEPVTITSSPAGYSNYTFYYDNGSGPVVLYTGASEEYTKPDGFTQGGQLAVVADNGSCSSQSTFVNFTINQLPLVTLTSDQTNDEFCFGTSVTFTAGNAVNYEFFVDNISQGTPSATNTFTTNTLIDGQVVKVVGIDGNGCEGENSITVKVNTATAGLSANPGVAICENESVTFTATGGVSYEFFVGTTSVMGPSALDTYSTNSLADGDVVSVKVIDANGCEDIHSGLTMTVTPEPTVILTSTAPAICLGTEVTFTATGADSYTFYYNNVLVQGPSATNTYVTTNLNDGDKVYAVGTLLGCEGISNIITTTVNPLPPVVLVSDQANDEFCSGTTVTFTAGGATTYEFFVDGSNVQGPSALNTYISSTLTNGQVVSVVGEDAIGCESIRAIAVIVNETTASLTSDKGNAICKGDEVIFTATGGNSYEFFINGGSDQGPSPLDTYKSDLLEDGDVVSVKVIDANGCEDTHPGITMLVSDLPTVTISPSGPQICQGESLNFKATGASQYEFFVNGLSVQGPSALDIYELSNPLDGDEIYVVGTDGTCNGTSATETIVVNALPTVILTASPLGAIVSGTEVTFTATGGVTYEYFVNSILVQGPSALDTYKNSTLVDGDVVSVKVTDANGCSNTEQIIVQVLDGIILKDVIARSNSYCEGESGVSVYVDDPQLNITYELIDDLTGTSAGASIENDGVISVEWNSILEGTYRVEAFYGGIPATRVAMRNTVTITKYQLPTIYDLSPTGKVTGCTSHDITLSNSDLTIQYSLLRDGVVDEIKIGTTGILTFEGKNVPGVYTIVAEDIVSSCSSLMNGQFEIESDGSLTAYDLFVESPADPSNPLDGRFCKGDAGVTLSLSNSGNSDLTYILYRAGDLIPVATVTGANGPISFGVISLPGTYTARVVSLNGCSLPMNGAVDVIEVVQPQQYALITDNTNPSSGFFCHGSSGLVLSLDNCEEGVIYELFLDATTLIDTQVGPVGGGKLDFTGAVSIIGEYSVSASINDLGCGSNMLNTIQLQLIDAPLDNTPLINHDYFCYGGSTELMIQSPELNVEYSVVKTDGTSRSNWESSLSDITFIISEAGDYNVEARKVENGITCSEVVMSGGPYIFTEEAQVAKPNVTSATAPDPCDGDIITVILSELDITYVVVYDDGSGNFVQLPGYSFVGDGNDQSFEPISDSGRDYYVKGINLNSCESELSTAININNPGAIAKQTVTGNGNICDASLPLNIGLTDSEASVDYILRYTDPSGTIPDKTIETITSVGGALSFTALNTYDSGEYYVVGNNGTCVNEMSNRITVEFFTPPSTDLTSDATGSVCAGTNITFTATGGMNYTFYVNGTNVQGPSALDTYVANALLDGDEVTVFVEDSNGCSATPAGITVQIDAAPAVGLIADNTIICDGDEVFFTASGASAYTFYVNGSVVQGPSSQDTYVTSTLINNDEVKVLGSNGTCEAESSSIVLTVNNLPTAGLTADPSGPIVSGTEVTFTATGGTEYAFFVNGSEEQARSTIDTYKTSSLNDGDQVLVQVYDGNSCMSSTSLVIDVLDAINIVAVLSTADQYCAGEAGVSVFINTPQRGVTYELIDVNTSTIIGSPITYTGYNLVAWDNVTAGEYMVEAYYASHPVARVEMNNRKNITENSLPQEYDLTPTGTVTDCNNPSGYDINLSGSELNVTYHLIVNNTIVASEEGTGSTIDFLGNLYIGTYEITAVNDISGCSALMNGSYTVDVAGNIYDLIVVGATDPTNGSYCAGTGGVELGLSNSEVGAIYKLYKDGIDTNEDVSGDGTPISFGLISDDGDYFVQAESAGCILIMNNTITVKEIDAPMSYNLRSDNPLDQTVGDYCYASSGINLYVDNQEEDVEYELFRDGFSVNIKVGSALSGTPLYFDGPFTDDGVYSVVANIKDISCTTDMANDIMVTEIPQPKDRTIVVDQDYFCTGDVTYLTVQSPEIGVSYRAVSDNGYVGEWFKAMSNIDLQLPVNSTGKYWVEARNGDEAYGCSGILMLAGPITEETLPTAVVISLENNADPCIGDVIVVDKTELGITYKVVYEDPSNPGTYIDLSGYELVGDGSEMKFDPISDSGRDYYVIAINAKGCGSDISNVVRIEKSGAIVKQTFTGQGEICSGELLEDFTLTSYENDVVYTLWFKSYYDNSEIPLTNVGTSDDNGILVFDSFFARGDGEYFVVGERGGCMNRMLNPILSTVNALPIAHSLSGSGITCDLVNVGAMIGLSDFESNTDYYLFYQINHSAPKVYKEDLDITQVPIEIAVHEEGIYSVVARNNYGCTSNMNGDITVIEYSNPLNYNLENTSFCSNEELLIEETELGVYYQVRNSLNEVINEFEGTATGNMSMGVYEEGTYLVTATRESVIDTDKEGACYTVMNGGVPADVNEAPETLYDLTCGGKDTDCTVEDDICIENSQPDIIYILYRNGVEVTRDYDRDADGKVCFGAVGEEGKYTILAYDPVSECSGIIGEGGGIDYGPIPYTDIVAVSDTINLTNGQLAGYAFVGLNDTLDSKVDIPFELDVVTAEESNIRYSLLDFTVEEEDTTWVTIPDGEKLKRLIGNYDISNIDGTLTFEKLPTFYGLDEVHYTIRNISVAGRIDTATVYVNVGNKDIGEDMPFLIPNAFSPNGDDFNDVFVIQGINDDKDAPEVSTLEVYNRWGSLVYRSKETYYGQDEKWWDGKSTHSNMVSIGQDCPNGTYFYIFTVKVVIDGEPDTKKYNGYIELRR
ncbi:gliding motility-associated C-terminal domain-containing protein [Saccharicrinis aurantiacus]|uniref:gliding motility-associated C-terminal domain-containing protein n=1 Tax=Saccharicrinis aurantiacus TaxID=1849719 RepID=UPI002492F375|nr:gliding motility-associated C-terminal domain-containing protein [Saccharicrinis aurantiacus]